MKIKSLQALEILDSRGNPTIRTILTLEDGSKHSASVPSGASTGSHEAVELRDGDLPRLMQGKAGRKRYFGKGVLKAVENVNTFINNEFKDVDVEYPDELDKELLALDGTENKSKLGANALLSVSMAIVKAAAYVNHKPLWQFLNEYYFKNRTPAFPRLMVNIVNGGKHASWSFDIQEFMVEPVETLPSKSVQISAEIFHQLGKILKEKKLPTLLGDEGGYAPKLSSNEEVIETIIEAAKKCGYKNGKDYTMGIDAAASEWYEKGKYVSHVSGKQMTQKKLIDMYIGLKEKYKMYTFEDIFQEDDWESWKKITGLLENAVLIGDDLFVTNPKRIQKGILEKAANAVLVKVNQIGTIFETVQAIEMTQDAKWKVVISHRSGETEDSFIADLAYACGADFIKAGSMARSERLAKYNRLLEIEKGL